MADLSLINWLLDGNYRIKVLNLLKSSPNIPTNISKKLGIHKSSLSRVLKDLYNKNLVEKITSDSRTITYKVSRLGEEILNTLSKKDNDK